MSSSVSQQKVRLLSVAEEQLRNYLGLHHQTISLSSLSSKITPLQITREGWSSMRTFTFERDGHP